jgi:hypothetical protein
MYVILTSKVGQFRTDPNDLMTPLEAYDYLFFGKKKAQFVIAELLKDGKVKVTEEGEGATINYVPTKFLPHFHTIEQARKELKNLVRFGDLDTTLVQR